MSRKRSRSLIARLTAVVLSVAVPSAVALIALVTASVLVAKRSQERELAATAQAISASLDTNLARSIATAESIAVSDPVANRDWSAVNSRVDRLRLGQAHWIAISDAAGRTLVNTYQGEKNQTATGLPRPMNIDLAVKEGRSRVSSLFTGTRSNRPVVAIDTPVLNSADALVVSLVFAPDIVRGWISQSPLPPRAMVTVVDARRRVIARTRDHDRFLGRFATPGMQDAMKSATAGVVPSRSLDGQRTTVAFHTSKLSGWTTLVVIPRQRLEAPILANALAIAFALAVVGGVSFWVVQRQARSISTEAAALRDDAASLGRGDAVLRREGSITEFDEINSDLATASRELDVRAERQLLLINELNHRVKNTLATVQAIAVQTMRGEGSDRVAAFQARLVALGDAHDLLTKTTWTEVDIRDLVSRCAGQKIERIHTDGPSLLLLPEAALGLCMCLHELETNSLKYGALSHATGRVELLWTLADEMVTLIWRETGGPPARAPASSGFGTRLMDRIAQNELKGSFERNYRDEGLVVTGTFRLGGPSRWSDPSSAP